MTRNQIAYQEHLENKRHNQAMESVQKQYNDRYLQELERHQMTGDVEAQRSNRAKESLQHEANVINDNHYFRQDIENQRHNQNVEGETVRHNYITEQLGGRTANIQQQQADTRDSEVANQNAYRMHQIQMNTLENLRAERRLEADLQRNTAQVKLFDTQAEAQGVKTDRERVGIIRDIFDTAENVINIFRKEAKQ